MKGMHRTDETPAPKAIDARGLSCPQPLLHLKKALDGLHPGAVVEIAVTDPHAELDFTVWCDRFGHRLECLDAERLRFRIVKGGLCES